MNMNRQAVGGMCRESSPWPVYVEYACLPCGRGIPDRNDSMLHAEMQSFHPAELSWKFAKREGKEELSSPIRRPAKYSKKRVSSRCEH